MAAEATVAYPDQAFGKAKWRSKSPFGPVQYQEHRHVDLGTLISSLY